MSEELDDTPDGIEGANPVGQAPDQKQIDAQPVEKPKRSFHWLRKYGVEKQEPVVLAGEQKAEELDDQQYVKDPNLRIEAYVEDLEDVFFGVNMGVTEEERALNNKKKKERITAIKPFLYNAYVIREENFPESYFIYKQREAENNGWGELEITPEYRKSEYEKNAKAQRQNLDSWVDYVTSDEVPYSPAIKFFIFKGMLTLGNFDEEIITNEAGETIDLKYSFTGRKNDTVMPVPLPDHEALGYVMETLKRVYESPDRVDQFVPTSELERLVKSGAGFGKIYAEALRELDLKNNSERVWEETEGEWRVFPQSDRPEDHRAMLETFRNKRSHLCIGQSESYAADYLTKGEMRIYYSKDINGEYTVPRVAVFVRDGQVSEVRGTYNKNEDLDPFIHEVLAEQLEALPGGQKYLKKVGDMRRMTEISKRVESGEELSSDDVCFLYELDDRIEGFGYTKDPRIEATRSKLDVFKELEKVAIIDEIQKTKAANYFAESILDGSCYESNFEMAYSYIIENGNSSTADLIAQIGINSSLSTYKTEKLISFLILKGEKSTIDYLSSIIFRNDNSNISEELSNRIWEYITQKGGDEAASVLSERLLGGQFSDQNREDVANFVEKNAGDLTVKKLVSKYLSESKNEMGADVFWPYGQTEADSESSINNTNFVWWLAFEKGGSQTAMVFADLIIKQDLSPENLSKAWLFISDKFSQAAARAFAEKISEENLPEGTKEQIWDFIINKGEDDVAGFLAYLISEKKLSNEDASKAWQVIYEKGGDYTADNLVDCIYNGVIPESDIDKVWSFCIERGGQNTVLGIGALLALGGLPERLRSSATDFVLTKVNEQTATELSQGIIDGEGELPDEATFDLTVPVKMICAGGGKEAAKCMKKLISDGILIGEDREIAEEFIQRVA